MNLYFCIVTECSKIAVFPKIVWRETPRPSFCSFMPAAIWDCCRHEAAKKGVWVFQISANSRKANICCGKVIEKSILWMNIYGYKVTCAWYTLYIYIRLCWGHCWPVSSSRKKRNSVCELYIKRMYKTTG